ncbi:MAG: hypothetical protein RIC55_26320 [Pirellulaceae bacterium]
MSQPSKPPLPPPPPPEEPQRGPSWLSLFLATLLGLIAVATLFFITNGVLGGVIVVGGVIFAITALHYFVWGRWLERTIRDAEEFDEP